MSDVLKILTKYLYRNIENITRKYGKNRTDIVLLDKKDCIHVFEDWCSGCDISLDPKSWRYSTKILENILTAGEDIPTVRLMLKCLME